MIIFKIGSDDRPACKADLRDFKRNLKKVVPPGNVQIVSHHMVDMLNIPEDAILNSGVIFKIGTDERPATEDDIADFRKAFHAARLKNEPLVWNHAVDFMVIPK